MEAAAQLHGLSVLIAEDNVDGADSMAMLIENDGHRVRVARDGISALDQALEAAPDVVCMDIGLPYLNGWEVARRIRTKLDSKHCRIIAISAMDAPEDRQRSARAGIDLHFAKPIDPSVLLALLERTEKELQSA